MDRPRLLDLFCGAGGAAMGYHRAGFDVTGVDTAPQPHYPFTFHQADALEYCAAHGHEYDVIHASPPCQGYSRLRHLPWLKGNKYPLMIEPMRELLKATGKPWIIENVEGAPMQNYITLCGTMFGLGWHDAELRRHRRFEIQPMPLLLVPPCQHVKPRVIGVYGKQGHSNQRACSSANYPVPTRKLAMGIDWMTGDELRQAIPPAYTEWIGRQLLAAMTDHKEDQL